MTTYHQIYYENDEHVLVDMANKTKALGTARSINVRDASGTHTGTAASFDGTGDVTIGLPATIGADITGNAQTATAADSATTAATAQEATHATSADSATTAGHATAADSATSADSAVKLATARTFRTNLASTSAPSFDGTADCTPGVSGVLPIQNGGTGSGTKNFVDLSSNQDVAGVKRLGNFLYFFGNPSTRNIGSVSIEQVTTERNRIILRTYDIDGNYAELQIRVSASTDTMNVELYKYINGVGTFEVWKTL